MGIINLLYKHNQINGK